MIHKDIKHQFWKEFYDPNKIAGISFGLSSPPIAKAALLIYVYKLEDISSLGLPHTYEGMEVIPKLMNPGTIPPGGFKPV